jgi:cell division protein FtsL
VTAVAMRSTWIEAWEGDLVPSAASRRSEARSEARDRAQSRAVRYYGREATARLPRSAPEMERPQALPKPRLVTRRMPQWRTIAGVLVFAALLLVAGVVSPTLVSSKATQVESDVGRMEYQQAQLSTAIAALSSQISALSAPDRVAEEASRLGLQTADTVHYMQSGMAEMEGDTTVAGR